MDKRQKFVAEFIKKNVVIPYLKKHNFSEDVIDSIEVTIE